MARSRSQRAQPHRRRIRARAALFSAFGILLLLASAGLSSLHTHATALDHHPHDGYARSGEAPTTAASAEESPVPIGSGPKSGLIGCDLCNLSRRSDSEVAILPETPIWVCDAPGATRAPTATHENPRAFAPTSTGPRAPPTLSA